MSDRSRVLVVDDEPIVRQALALVLGDTFDVVVADDGETALATLEADAAFDLILSDVHMRQVGGLEMFQRLRAQAPELSRRLVLMSGALDAVDLDSIARWSIPFLSKPFQGEMLCDVVEREIGAARNRNIRSS
jgi:two-component system, response regulator FlrC